MSVLLGVFRGGQQMRYLRIQHTRGAVGGVRGIELEVEGSIEE